MRKSNAAMKSEMRQALVACEVTDAISRAFLKDGDITCVEVAAALGGIARRWLEHDIEETIRLLNEDKLKS
jgi:hypothetical protein